MIRELPLSLHAGPGLGMEIEWKCGTTNFQAQAEGMTTEDVIQKLLDEIPEPDVPKFEK